MNYNLPLIICKKNYLTNNLRMIHTKYGNHVHFSKFIESIGVNINNLTPYNIDKVFKIFILVCLNKFRGFECWGPGNNKTPNINVISHYNKHVVNSNNENWKDYLSKLDVATYKNFAITKSKYMKNKIVHTNGVKVYLSGWHDKILIIGRLDSNNKLGISSCYIISDNLYDNKIKIFEQNICFKF